MSEVVFVAILGGGITLIGTIFTVVINSTVTGREMNAKLDKAQAVTQTRLDELTREVREHNDFGRRIPLLEEKIKVVNHRLDDLEGTKK